MCPGLCFWQDSRADLGSRLSVASSAFSAKRRNDCGCRGGHRRAYVVLAAQAATDRGGDRAGEARSPRLYRPHYRRQHHGSALRTGGRAAPPVDRLQLPHWRRELEAAQDVTALGELVRDVRTDLPVQVRYEPHNPANSIVVAEGWSGLRLSADVPRPLLGIDRHEEESRDHTTHVD